MATWCGSKSVPGDAAAAVARCSLCARILLLREDQPGFVVQLILKHGPLVGLQQHVWEKCCASSGIPPVGAQHLGLCPNSASTWGEAIWWLPDRLLVSWRPLTNLPPFHWLFRLLVVVVVLVVQVLPVVGFMVVMGIVALSYFLCIYTCIISNQGSTYTRSFPGGFRLQRPSACSTDTTAVNVGLLSSTLPRTLQIDRWIPTWRALVFGS